MRPNSSTHLKLNVRLSLVLLATTTASDLLCFRNLVSHSLEVRLACAVSSAVGLAAHICAEVLKRVALDGVYAENRVGLHGRETARHW